MFTLTKKLFFYTLIAFVLCSIYLPSPAQAEGFGISVGPNYGQSFGESGGDYTKPGKDGDYVGYSIGINYLFPKTGPITFLGDLGVNQLGNSFVQTFSGIDYRYSNNITYIDLGLSMRLDLTTNLYLYSGGFIGFVQSAEFIYNNSYHSNMRSYINDTINGYKVGLGYAFSHYEVEVGWMATVGGLAKNDDAHPTNLEALTLTTGYRF